MTVRVVLMSSLCQDTGSHTSGRQAPARLSATRNPIAVGKLCFRSLLWSSALVGTVGNLATGPGVELPGQSRDHDQGPAVSQPSRPHSVRDLTAHGIRVRAGARRTLRRAPDPAVAHVQCSNRSGRRVRLDGFVLRMRVFHNFSTPPPWRMDAYVCAEFLEGEIVAHI